MPLHPQARDFLDGLKEQNAPSWEELSSDEGRELFARLTDLFGEAPDVSCVQDLDDLRIYTPEGDGPFPAVVYFHGGGWVLGDRLTHDALCRRLANAAACVVVSVDYSRAPEYKFPEPLENCYRATRFVAQNSERFQIDANRIAVAGDSAGGNLAAGVALMARDQGSPSICFQLLIYPVLNHNFYTGSYDKFAEGFGLTKAAMRWFWKQYLRREDDGSHPYASPLASDNLRGLPAAHVITAQYDVLRDEADAYAAMLNDAGVSTTLQRYDGMIHGFTHLAGVFDSGKQSVEDAAAVLREAFG